MSKTNINETMITQIEDKVEHKEDAVEKSRCKRICRTCMRFSLFELRVGILDTEENVYRPIWARIISWIIVIGLIGYGLTVYLHLFKQILGINSYSMGYDIEMINNATLPGDRDLLPWELRAGYNCNDLEVIYSVLDKNNETIRDNIKMDCTQGKYNIQSKKEQ